MLTPARTGEALAAWDDPTRGPLFGFPRRSHGCSAGLTLLGAVLRFVTVSHQSFWLDEALAARELHLSFGSML